METALSSSTQESSLLLTLEEISQLVSHSHHPGETLANIVNLIQKRFHTDVCSVYLLEAEQGELVLGATVGLKPESVGRVRMRIDEGLTGLVAEKMTPVMVSDAFTHPRFKFFPEAGEDPYHFFLGVPLVEGGALQGVLVVQTREPRTFSPNETRMLVTVGAQLAPLVSEARLLEQVVAVAHLQEPAARSPADDFEQITVHGTSLSPGTGRGRAYLVNGFSEWRQTTQSRSNDFAGEQSRLAAAMDGARDEITRLSQRISALVGEDHGAILQGQLMIMQDSTIEDDLTACMKAGCSAEAALLQTLNKYVEAFQKLTNPFFQERVYDIKDVFRRILWHLRPGWGQEEDRGEKLVIVAHEASVMDLFSVDLDRLAAVVVEHGGPQSHAAILARSLGIPMVGQLSDLVSRIHPGRQLLVDGTAGQVYINCSPDPNGVNGLAAQPTAMVLSETPVEDDFRPGTPRIEANINLLCEVAQAVNQGASGVGLYRSEFLFLARRTLPTEEEQYGIYCKLLQALRGRPASIRTFDLRPDKLAHYAHLTFSTNHPLDWRLVLDSPPLQKLFKDQVRAILRAGTVGPARILVPLVMRSEQLDFVLETVDQARFELEREGLAFGTDVPLGIMIEVAAATTMVGTWAKHVDFFALGTNDLAASALGIDRDDPVGTGGADPLHPGLLRMIYDVVLSAHRADRRVTVCGEMASDPEGLLGLSSMQVDSISVAVQQLPAVRHALHSSSALPDADLASELVGLRTASQVRQRLRCHARTANPLPAF
ncbi:MAG TPA: putative PEP-binding protein [Gemmataceae bacterium]|nr:putative PEP-binding protein [Gemmataceae bacterium]